MLTQPRAIDTPAQTSRWQAIGAGSCAASSCHGGSLTGSTKGSEYSIWASRDKHAQAYTVLFDERSRTIEKNLNRLGNLHDAHPEKNALCLKCHGLVYAPAHSELQSDGVSCEACHGPAQAWVERHYEAGWKTLPAAAKNALGFVDAKDLLQRGKSCLACHVGTGSQQVNHDLIAAGHPRLNLELSAYMALMPRHWNQYQEKQRIPDLEARTWFIGQVLAAQAALELLADRASDSRQSWPEFAEYDCFACHHDLKNKSWRAGVPAADRKLGGLPWGTWYMSQLDQALPAKGLVEAVSEVRRLLYESAPRNQIADRARQAAKALGAAAPALAARQLSASELNALLDAVVHQGDNRGAWTWDRSTQTYLALAAFVNARSDIDPASRNERLEQKLRGVANLLRFPGPGTGRRLDSPSEYNPADVEKALKDLSFGPSR